MTLLELQKIAAEGYAKGEGLGDYFNQKNGQPKKWHTGDSLEYFMVNEIAETFNPEATNEAQLTEATRVLKAGQRDLQGAIEKLRTLGSKE